MGVAEIEAEARRLVAGHGLEATVEVFDHALDGSDGKTVNLRIPDGAAPSWASIGAVAKAIGAIPEVASVTISVASVE